ncbi:MAG TPA: hypothetical protein PKD51_08210 [Saprospiraceae bacterium]|nr:hypothetical protein [Saprospiraceae bacterium]
MRIQLLLLFLLLSQINATSQDTLALGIDTTEEPVFLNNYDHLQLNKEDVSRMFFLGTEIGAEQRLFHKFSFRTTINVFGISPYVNKTDFVTDNNFTFGGFNAFVNYYPFLYSPTSRKTNLSGLYLGVGFGLYFADKYENTEDFNIDSIKLIFNGDIKNFGRKTAVSYGSIFTVGYQQRIFDIMYYHIRLNFANLRVNQLDPDNFNTIRSKSKLYIIPSIDLGFSIHSARKKYNFVNYQIQKTHLLKFDFLRLFEFTPFNGHGLNASFEQLLPNKPISLIGGLDFNFSKQKTYSDENFKVGKGYDHFIGSELFGEVRYYHNLEKRRLAGKIGNGFSANYFALNLSVRHTYTRQVYDDFSPTETFNRYGFAVELLYGVQRELGKHLYVDIRGGLRPINVSLSGDNDTQFRWLKRTFGFYFGFTK